MLPLIKSKVAVKYYIIDACKRQYGFAPQISKINVDAYNRQRIIFTVCGRQYKISDYKDIPVVTLINCIRADDF